MGPDLPVQTSSQYTQNHGILHTFATPYHPSTNGLAKRSVQILTQGLRTQEGPIHTRLTNLLFHYRITPQTTTGLSPAELPMGRRLRCKFTLLHPDTGKGPKLQQQKLVQVQNPRMHSFEVGEKLYARSFGRNKTWIPVVVNSKTGPMSYRLRTNDGQLLRRHLDQLRKRYQAEPNKKDETDLDDWPMWSRPRQPIPIQPAQLRRSTRTR